MKKVFIVMSSGPYRNMFLKAGYEIVSRIEDADLVCFTGGEDVTPSLYGEPSHPNTFSNMMRDSFESKIFNLCANTYKLPMVGICRGGQFLNVMNGGKMYQHVSRHCEDHFLTTSGGEQLMVSSTHHQIMRPAPHGTVLAVANQEGFKQHVGADGSIVTVEDGEEDEEVVLYKKTRSLCFQPHPEFVGPGYEEMTEYFFNLLESL